VLGQRVEQKGRARFHEPGDHKGRRTAASSLGSVGGSENSEDVAKLHVVARSISVG
jgi:hypothetical protein